MLSKQIPLGIYEKALPAGECWLERLQLAKALGFDFVEMSLDETDVRLARLDWSPEQRLALVKAVAETGVRVPSMCLSAHRRFPLGSEDDAVRHQGLEIMRKAIQLAQDVGIRVIQLAGYDVYYEPSTRESRERYYEGMERALQVAAVDRVDAEPAQGDAGARRVQASGGRERWVDLAGEAVAVVAGDGAVAQQVDRLHGAVDGQTTAMRRLP